MSVNEKEKVTLQHLTKLPHTWYLLLTSALLSLTQDPAALKEEGNTLFKAGDMQGAVCCYTKALKLSDSQTERAVLHRNRSACYLKLEDYSKAETDASKGEISQNSTTYKKYPHKVSAPSLICL